MRIGILGAMLDEVRSIEALMSVSDIKETGSRTFIEGKIADLDVVLTFSRWGKVASASTTTTLINLFNVDFVIFTGVAGAVDTVLNIGDIVIANGLYQHDMDARPIFDKHQIPLTDTLVFKPHHQHIENAVQASKAFLAEIDIKLPSHLLSKYAISEPKVQSGLIASGDKFITDVTACEDLYFEHNGNKTMAIEMEGAAIAQVCTDHNIPFVVIRTISDKADHSALIDFQSFVSEVAAIYSVEIISNFIRFF